MLVAAIALVAALAIGISGMCSRGGGGGGSDEPVPVNEPDFTFTLESGMIDAIPVSESPSWFSLSSLEVPSNDSLGALEAATEAAREYGSIGYIIIDLSTGIGISYQADYAPYGASTIKGVYAAYVCEDAIDTGKASLDMPVEGYYMGVDFSYQYFSTTVGGLLHDMVMYSDNDAFGVLKQLFDDDWYDWTADHDISAMEASFDDWFPFYSPRTGIRAWAHIYEYLESGSDGAAYLESLYGQTEVSFIRDGVDTYDVTVLNKAGWWVEYDSYWNCVSDNAIIRSGDHTYLVSIMSGLPDSGEGYARVSGVAAALYEAYL